MTNRIEISWQALMDQAASTTHYYIGQHGVLIKDYRPPGVKGMLTMEELALAVEMAKASAMDYLASAISVAAHTVSDGLQSIALKTGDVED